MAPAQLLRTVRRRRGLTQAQLAERAATSQPVVSAYENGHRDPTYSTLRRLVEACGERLVLDASGQAAAVPPAADAAEHGRRLREVLSVADAVPVRRAATWSAPRLVSR